MKFAYADETGTGDGTSVVLVGVVVDAQRMHITKNDWESLVAGFAKETGKQVRELHFRDFYRGRKAWDGLPGDRRAAGITYILEWLNTRKHKLTFSALHRESFDQKLRSGNGPATELGTAGRAAATHLLLQLQKEHQRYGSNKGHTVLIFDHEEREEAEFLKLHREPPAWTDTYYERGKKQERFDQFVDVPYFADSEHVLLVQAADMVAYLLGRYTKLYDDGETPAYPEEWKRIKQWIPLIQSMLLTSSCRYPKKGRCACAEFFWDLCPASLREL